MRHNNAHIPFTITVKRIHHVPSLGRSFSSSMPCNSTYSMCDMTHSKCDTTMHLFHLLSQKRKPITCQILADLSPLIRPAIRHILYVTWRTRNATQQCTYSIYDRIKKKPSHAGSRQISFRKCAMKFMADLHKKIKNWKGDKCDTRILIFDVLSQ